MGMIERRKREYWLNQRTHHAARDRAKAAADAQRNLNAHMRSIVDSLPTPRRGREYFVWTKEGVTHVTRQAPESGNFVRCLTAESALAYLEVVQAEPPTYRLPRWACLLGGFVFGVLALVMAAHATDDRTMPEPLYKKATPERYVLPGWRMPKEISA